MSPFLRCHALLGLVLVILVDLVGSRWCQAQPQQPPPTATPQAAGQGLVNPFPDMATVEINTTGLAHAFGTLSQPTHFAKPVGQAWNRQTWRLEVCAPTPQPVTWDAVFKAQYGTPLPTTTRGGGTCDLWGFLYQAETGLWQFFATTPPAPRP